MAENSLTLIHGSGDLVALLEEMLEQVKRGEIYALALCVAKRDGNIGWAWNCHEEAPHAWARLLGAVASAQQDLLTEGL